MTRLKRSGAALAALTLALCACDRLPQRWAFRTGPSSVTVKLPPAKTPAPGFQFGSRTPADDGASLNSR